MSNTPTFPTAEELRAKIAEAKDRDLFPIRDEAHKILEAFRIHIAKMLAHPEKFTSHTLFGYDNPNYGTGEANKRYFYECLRKGLPAGYHVEASHDGGGMYEVAVIRWDEVKTMRTVKTSREEARSRWADRRDDFGR